MQKPDKNTNTPNQNVPIYYLYLKESRGITTKLIAKTTILICNLFIDLTSHNIPFTTLDIWFIQV